MGDRFYKMYRNGKEFGSCSSFDTTCSRVLFNIQSYFPPTEGWIDKNGDALNFAYGYVDKIHFYRVIDGHTETGSVKYDNDFTEDNMPFLTIYLPALSILITLVVFAFLRG